ncbi:hypothetical protein [Holzapfeliella floricola]|uniref:Uncharacterized protein n=1 Tax=Holzapfeliella floricola DSM 23037 = JCM 16512 TaxID=1423744 RepID=A0A0R2DST7_9LACO|nr:hypothetical protein [Holzapfeliella floricola]KRN03532.1 hypothetical protein FC86_GL000637 [Holzapfeliella floricola DSM 23037 = JCM 16512]
MIDILYFVISALLCYFLIWQRLNVKFLDKKQGTVVKLLAIIGFLIMLITAATQSNVINWSVLLLIEVFCVVLIFFRSGLGSIIFKNYRIRSYREFTKFEAEKTVANGTKVKFYANNQVRMVIKVQGSVDEVTQFLNKYFI